MKILFLCLILSLLSLSQSQGQRRSNQNKNNNQKAKTTLPHGHLVVNLELLDPNLALARGYNEKRRKLDVKAHMIMYRDFEWQRVQTFTLPYDSLNDRWSARLPYGTYYVNVQDLGFDFIERMAQINNPDTTFISPLLEGPTPYTYDKGGRYTYIRGSLCFSETLIVRFAGGKPLENLAFLQQFPHERIQQLRDERAFYFTANIGSSDTISDMLRRRSLGIKDPFYGYLIGDSLNVLIEAMRENPNVLEALPTFFNAKEDKFLILEEYAHSQTLENKIREELRAGNPIHPRLLARTQFTIEQNKPKAPRVKLDENGEALPENKD